MESLMKLMLALSLAFASSAFCAQSGPHHDVIAESLFPPELIMENAGAINLTEEQQQKLQAELETAHARFDEMHSKLEQQREATAMLLKKSRVDESAVMAQFEKVLDQERDARRAHLALMISLKNKLTPEQQRKLEEIRKRLPKPEVERRSLPGKPPPASLREKMEKLKSGIKRIEDQGGDAGSIGEVMREFKPLIDEQKFKEAEDVVDEALKLLQQQKR